MALDRFKTFNLINFLRHLSWPYVVIFCATFMVLVLMIDWFSGPVISTSIFYLLPIYIATWIINRRTGFAFSIAGALLWFITDYFTNPNLTTWVLPFWNAIVRLGFFLIVVLSLSALRRSRQRQEDLTAFVIHDLRAPLGNIMTALDMLQYSDINRLQDSSLIELIKLGQSSGQRLLVLVDSLLDLSRMESGKIQVQKDSILLANLFKDSISQVMLTAEFKKIRIEQKINPPETAVLADTALSQRIIVNLLSNAIKFSPEHAVILLQAELANCNQAIITVQDQGKGIPTSWQQRIFSKYEQVSGGGSGGSGLGLAYCKMAVEAQDGRIWMESEKDKGTTFLFSLPATPTA